MRDHWAVENARHWVMDMVFRDDECRLRTEHAPANFTTTKHIALNLIRRAKQDFNPPPKKSLGRWFPRKPHKPNSTRFPGTP